MNMEIPKEFVGIFRGTDLTEDEIRTLNWITGWEHQTVENLRSAVQKAQGPTLTPPNEWVSVETEMPPEDERVLCIVNGNPRSNITLEDAYQLGSWSKSDGWIIDEWPDWEGANVVWWRPLPAPPDRRPPEGETNA
ncbi:DUF551 domain-containing protein [uncultured Intestinimonas sp.]|uniref:DUF551 domain-containing protein n=1 Tax=uncultured Intestinimonas sp. TaxID=1689265 RepID=UPI0025E1A23C|nr:DUF551 domain-containing protein [uncultured Intestinimonas sp.]